MFLTLLLIGLPLTGMLLLYVSFEGGWESLVLNHTPAPDQDRPDVAAKRAEARATAEAALSGLNGSSVLTPGPASYSAYCERGQNNFKVHEGYRHSCSVVTARFYTWKGPFPAMARALDKELTAAGWAFDEYEGGLPLLAKQYEAGRNPHQNPTPGVPVVLDFADSWSTCYEKAERHVCFAFADRNTDLASQSDFFDFTQRRDAGGSWSYTENRETVDSRSTITHLLEQSDGVLFATDSEPYYSVSR